MMNVATERRPRGARLARIAPLPLVALLASACVVDARDADPERTASVGERLDARVRAVGRLMCNGAPLAGVRVDMMNSNSDTDTISDQWMGSGVTDDGGYFSFEGTGGDPGNWSWSRPDVYVRAVYDTWVGPTRVRVTNELDNARVDDTPEHQHDNQSAGAIVSIGVQTFRGIDCALWQNATAAVRDFQAVTGTQLPPGHYDVERWSAIYSGTPWTNLDTTHWPTNYAADRPTAFHELAHAVRHTLDGDANHFNWDVTRFVYARMHSLTDKTNEGFAFNEGWAEYWANARAGDWLFGSTPTNDWEVEGNVGVELRRLAQCAGIGDAKMVDVLRGHAGAIHSMEEFRQAFDALYPNACRPFLRFPPGALAGVVRSPQREAVDDARPIGGEVRAPRAALAAITMDTIRGHVEDGTYDAWKRDLRAGIAREELAAARARVEGQLAALASSRDDASLARAAELRASLRDLDAIARAADHGDVPLEIQP